MLLSLFSCPYATRLRHGDEGDYYIVDDAVVAVEHEFKKVLIFEKDEYMAHGLTRPAALEIGLLSSSTSKVSFRRWKSENENFESSDANRILFA